MQLLKRSLGRLVVSLFAIVALGFAGSEAFAADVNSACPYNPPVFLGECASQQECQDACVAVGGIEGRCGADGCCRCFL